MAKNRRPKGKKIIAGLVATTIVAGAGVASVMAIQNAYADPNAGNNTQTEAPGVNYEELQEQLATVTAQLTEKTTALQETQSQVETLMAEIENIENELSSATADRELLQSQLENANADLAVANAKIEQLNKEIEELKASTDESEDETTLQYTSASYFKFSGSSLTGLSEEGQTLYDNGELSDIVLPRSYSLGESTQQEMVFDNYDELEIYCYENTFFEFDFEYNGEIFSITNEEDYNNYRETIMNYFADGNSLTLVVEVQPVIDGTDYVVTNIENSAFNSCTSLTSVVIPNGITSIGALAFNSTGLTNVTIPNSVTSIGVQAFMACKGLTNITIPSSVTSIGTHAFIYCSSLTEINVDADNPNYASLEGVLFNKDITKLIRYPEGATATTYSIPSTVTSIDVFAFSDCKNILEYDFTNCTIVPTLGGTNVFNKINEACKIYVPDELYDEWKVATSWSTYESYIYKASEMEE